MANESGFLVGQLVRIKGMDQVGAVASISTDGRRLSMGLSKSGKAFTVVLPTRAVIPVTVDARTLYPDGTATRQRETLRRVNL
jgi:hypothetical protein